jgi:hypothetical protein
VEADDIRAFARPNRDAVAESKADFWAARKRTMTAGEALAVAEALRAVAVIHAR